MTPSRIVSLALALFASLPLAASGTELMPLAEVKRGMRGHGLTVFQGDTIEKFDVEILGVLRNIAPGQNLILARVDSEPVKTSGIIAGMSGSPVIIDGKVIGALAFAWQFSKESIAGITPIDDMLLLDQRGGAGSLPPDVGVRMNSSEVLKALANKTHLPLFEAMVASALPQRMSGISGALPISIPLSFGNFSTDTVKRFGSYFEASGFLPAPTGQSMSASTAGTSGKSTSTTFQPGDAVAAVLLDGDFSMAATGTVTHVDGDRVWGFGHPFLDMGAISFPMAKAEVVAVLPNLARSFKFSNTGEIVGALTQDRAAGILGQMNGRASMIPVKLTIDGDRDETYNFRVADHPQLMPVLLAMSVDSVISNRERAAGERSVVLEADIHLKSRKEPLRLREAWSGSEVRQSIPAYLGLVANYMISNEYQKTQVESVQIRLRHDDSLKIARLLDATVEGPDGPEFRPGDKVRVRARFKPFRGDVFSETLEVTIPASQKAGEAYLIVGSGSSFNQLDFMLVPPDPQSFEQVVSTIERLRSSRELSTALYAESDGAVTAGVYMRDLPPSMKAVVSTDSSNAAVYPVKYAAISRTSKPLDYVIDGLVRVDVSIRPRS